jgi:hypothetical protein
MLALKDRQAAEDESLHYMFDYQAVTNGRFPVMYAIVTPSEEDEISLDMLMQAQGFQRFR